MRRESQDSDARDSGGGFSKPRLTTQNCCLTENDARLFLAFELGELQFDDLRESTTTKFQAVKRTGGMSLFDNDEEGLTEPERRAWSAEAVGCMMTVG